MKKLSNGSIFLKATVLLVLVFMLNPLLLRADDPNSGDFFPCDGNASPYGDCPLDGGVTVCLVIALVFGVYLISKNKKPFTS